MKHSRRISRGGNRGSASAMAILGGLLKVFLPLLIIAIGAYVLLNYRASASSSLRVTTSIPGADILVGGVQTGFVTDTTLSIPSGRSIITVRKEGLVSDPEFVVVDVRPNEQQSVQFLLQAPKPSLRQDTIPPLREVRQEVFSTGELVQTIPPAVPRYERHLVDFSRPEIRRESRQSGAQGQSAGQLSGTTESIPTSIQGTQVTVTSAPMGGEIWVNGAITTRQTPYTFRGLDRGVYSFRVRMDGFLARPESTLVTLTDDYQSELASFELLPDSTSPRPTLTITTKPIASGIRLDGRQIGVGQVTTDATYGTHKIEFADVAGYKTPSTITAILTADEPNASIVGEYNRLSGDAYVAVRPSEDLEKFDATKLRIYVDNELLLDGSKKAFDAALLGHLVSGKRLIRIHYGDLTDDIHVSTVDGQVAEITFRVESFFSKRKLRLRDKDMIPVEQWQEKAKKLDVLTLS